MKLIVKPSLLNGVISPPSSKSYINRFLLAALLSNESVTLDNVTFSNDVVETINCVKEFGKIVSINGNSITLSGNILKKEELNFVIKECASTLRFIIPLAILFASSINIKVGERLLKRGIDEYVSCFQNQDVIFNINKDVINIKGSLKPGHYYIRCNRSSQYLTGLLFALPLLNKSSIIEIEGNVESEDYINMTLDVLNRSKIAILKKDNGYLINGNQHYDLRSQIIETDYSLLACLDAFNLTNGNIHFSHIINSLYQGDKRYAKYYALLKEGYAEIDIKNVIDLGPILFTVASLFKGAKFINTHRLEYKESNRVLAMKEELLKFGIEVTVSENEVIIDNKNIHSPDETLDSHFDHRIFMALMPLLIKYGGEIVNVECVNKSYPDYIDDIIQLEGKVIKV